MNSQAIEALKIRLGEVEYAIKSRHYRMMDFDQLYRLIDEEAELRRLLRQNSVPRRSMGQPCNSGHSHLAKEGIMHIEFEADITPKLTFNMVRPGQMFVEKFGDLYQKSWDEDDEENNAWRISNSDGEPRGGVYDFSQDEEIKRILPPIRRIAF